MRQFFKSKKDETKFIYQPPGFQGLMDAYDSIFEEDTYLTIQEKVMEHEKRKEVYVETAADVSITGQTYFPSMYLAMKEVIKSVEGAKKMYPGVTVKYGLTLFHEELSEIVSFEEGPFTEHGEEYLESLLKIRFSGGSLDGYENLNEGLSYAVDKLESHTPKESRRVLFAFSDSCQKPGKRNPDFQNMGKQGLHMAVIFCKDDADEAYAPVFRNANHTETVTKVFSIDKLAKRAGENCMVNSVLNLMRELKEECE